MPLIAVSTSQEVTMLFVGVVAVAFACLLFILAREFSCWFWKTTAITEQLTIANRLLKDLRSVLLNCDDEMIRANEILKRIAPPVTITPTSDEGGNHGIGK